MSLPERVACIVIDGGRRHGLLRELILPSVLSQGFDEVIVAGEIGPGDGYRFLSIPAVTRTTLDALMKRDAGTVATESEVLVYLSCDHRLGLDFLTNLRAMLPMRWDVLVPGRFTMREDEIIPLNNGEEGEYAAGHCAVFRRRVIQHTPWIAQPHHPNWDLLASQAQRNAGFAFLSVPMVQIEDVEGGEPWL